VPVCLVLVELSAKRKLSKNRLSNNVGSVKHFASTLRHALGQERLLANNSQLVQTPDYVN